MLPGALAGFSFGMLSDRFGAKRVAIFGLLVAAVASLASGFSASFGVLVLLRIIEGAGYTLLVVAGTVVAAGVMPGRSAIALSVWSSFAPIGFALGQWAAAYAPEPPLLAIGAWHAGVLVFAALLLHLCIHDVPPRPQSKRFDQRPRPSAGAVHRARVRRCVRVLLASIALGPVALARQSQLPVAYVASLTALAALPSILGRIAPGWLLDRGFAPFTVFATATALGALTLPRRSRRFRLWRRWCSSAASRCSPARCPGLLSAMLPHVAPTPAQLGTVSGMCSQAVNIGNLIGPPLALAVYAAAGSARRWSCWW